MRLLDYVKQIFSSGEYVNEDDLSIHDEDSQDFESYYIPPAEDVFQNQNTLEKTKSQEEDYTSQPQEALVVDSPKNNDSEIVQKSQSEANMSLPETDPKIKDDEKLYHFQDNVISIIEEFDSYINRTENDDAKELISLFQHRLIESLAESGLDKIDSDISFDCIRHIPVPFQIIPEGTPINKIIRAGLSRNGCIVLKALITTNSGKIDHQIENA